MLNPPKKDGICDKCGTELIGRSDDTEETVKNRLANYFEQTSPLVDYYENKEVLYSAEVSRKINKMGAQVAQDIIKHIKEENI